MNATPSLGEEVHRGVLDVLMASAAPGCRSFAELLEHVPGAYPPDVAAALTRLTRLTALRLVDAATHARLTRNRGQVSAATAAREAWELVLPEPHPLDYDWRWDQRTAGRLLAHCLRASSRDDTVALLGTPTLMHAAATPARHWRWVLLESSAALRGSEPRCAAPGTVRPRPIRTSCAPAGLPPWRWPLPDGRSGSGLL